MTKSYISFAVLAASLVPVTPALAFHQKTPAVVPLTTEGDVDLPRIPAQGRRAVALVVPDGGDTKIVSLSPHKTGSEATLVFSGGDNEHPATSGSGKSFAWDTDDDPLGSGAPGRQVIISGRKGVLSQAAVDPTGTSTNPDMDKSGRVVVFESAGDLVGIENGGARQIFMRNRNDLIQVTTGQGDSRNPMISKKRKMLCYESSSDPATGVDTGVSQIFAGRYDRLPTTRITAGQGASRNPSVSDDGRLVVFESLADLAGSGAATGVPQIFAYDTRTETYAQLTSDPGGCTGPASGRRGPDWRITFICNGEPQFFMLREGVRYRVQTSGGTTQSILPELGSHFVMISTTANVFSGGTTAEHRVYMINLFARPAEPIAGTATWFPFQGIN